MNLTPLFTPRSIAVIGASPDRSKLGNMIFRNCRETGYSGPVFPVHPHAPQVEGVRAYTSVVNLPRRTDLAIIATPADTVLPIMRDVVRARIPAACIISAGFSESGTDGVRREGELRRIAEKGRVALLGPNCLGFLAPHRRLNASFAHGLPAAGAVSIVSQSGAMAVAIADWASESGLGFRYLISLGNKTIINERDVLRYLAADQGTKVVLMYLEDVRSGSDFLREVAAVARRLPVVVIMAGRTKAAAAAIASHTGALVSSGEAVVAALRSAGCIVVSSIEEWFNCARAFVHPYIPRGSRVAIVTNAGGPGILATDAVGREGMQMAAFTAGTLSRLRKGLPRSAALRNPIDVIGDAPPERYAYALRTALADPGVDAVLAVLTHQVVTDSRAIAKAVSDLQHTTKKPIYASFVGGRDIHPAVDLLREQGIPAFGYPESAIQALRRVADWRTHIPVVHPHTVRVSPPLRSSDGVLIGQNAIDVLVKSGMSAAPGVTVKTADSAVRAATKLGLPVVMKVTSLSAIHKTDAKGVVVDVHSASAVRETVQDFLKRFGKGFRKTGDGILIQPHIMDALEVFIGAVRTPQFGPMVLVGLGGIFVESLREIEYAPAPLTRQEARRVIMRTSLWPIIRGTRGKTFAVHRLVESLTAMSSFIARHREVSSVDCNPVLLTTTHSWMVDARIILS